jgi:hypothetical protein
MGGDKPWWVKGHLLNGDLGGPGVSYNLTPLSQNANKSHDKKVEEKVKAAVTWCRQYGERNPNDTLFYGVYYKVTVSDGKAFPKADKKSGPLRGLTAVADKITCTAYYVKRSKSGNERPTKCTPTAKGGMGAPPSLSDLQNGLSILCYP